MTVNSGSTTVSWYNEPIDVNNVDVSLCNDWFLSVHTLLEKLNLKDFIQEQAIKNKSGNYSEFKLQLENINNLYELAEYLNNKKLHFKTTAYDFEKNILFIILSVNRWQSYLSTYQKIIGYNNFREIMDDLNDKKYFNFNIKFCYKNNIYVMKGDTPITIKGMERFKYINSWGLKIKYFTKENWKFIYGIGGLSTAIIVSIYFAMNNIYQQNSVIIKDVDNNKINIELNNVSDQNQFFQNNIR